jgi:hypothetical protein
MRQEKGSGEVNAAARSTVLRWRLSLPGGTFGNRIQD